MSHPIQRRQIPFFPGSILTKTIRMSYYSRNTEQLQKFVRIIRSRQLKTHFFLFFVELLNQLKLQYHCQHKRVPMAFIPILVQFYVIVVYHKSQVYG